MKNVRFNAYFAILIVFLVPGKAFSQYDSIPFDGYNRTYLLHLPPGYTGRDELPMIIAMHGGFGSAANLQNQSQLSVKADAENFIVVYPEGVKGGPLNIRTWNAGWCCGWASTANIDDVGFIDALLDTLISRYTIDTSRIYATGMSNGGFMSYRLACELPDRIAAIAPVASSMSMTSCNPVRPVPVIHFHSYLDDNVPYLGGVGAGPSKHYNPPQDSVMKAWAVLNGCSALHDTIMNNNEYTFTQWRKCDCNAEIHHYITTDGGHSWPGGEQTPTGDPVSDYISANDLMWAFFQKHSLRCGIITSSDDSGPDHPDFMLYPNPTKGLVHIARSGTRTNFTITVYDQTGKMILEQTDGETIDLTPHPPGIYFVIIDTSGQMVKRKLIKSSQGK